MGASVHLMALNPCIGDEWVAAVVYVAVDSDSKATSRSVLVFFPTPYDPDWRYLGSAS